MSDLAHFDELHDGLVLAVESHNWQRARALLTAQLTADRGMQRCALVALKPVRHHPGIAEAYDKLADALRSTSAHGTI